MPSQDTTLAGTEEAGRGALAPPAACGDQHSTASSWGFEGTPHPADSGGDSARRAQQGGVTWGSEPGARGLRRDRPGAREARVQPLPVHRGSPTACHPRGPLPVPCGDLSQNVCSFSFLLSFENGIRENILRLRFKFLLFEGKKHLFNLNRNPISTEPQ